MIFTNQHKTIILGQEYRFQIKGCEIEAEQRDAGRCADDPRRLVIPSPWV